LKHTFDNDYGDVKVNTTNNIMDYTPDVDHLAKWQWEIIRYPALFTDPFGGDEEGEYVNFNDDVKNIKNILHMIKNRYGTSRHMPVTCPRYISSATNITVGKYKYDRITVQLNRANSYRDVNVNYVDTIDQTDFNNYVGFLFDNKVNVFVNNKQQREHLKKYLFDKTSDDDFMPAFKKINENDLYQCIISRMNDPSLIDQGSTPLCGMATIANVMAMHDKEGYKNLIKDLYYYSYAYYYNNSQYFFVNPYNLSASDVWEKGPGDPDYPSGTPVCDYVLLTSLKSNIGLLPYTGGESGDHPYGITLPSQIEYYAKNLLGMKDVEDKTVLIGHYGDFSELRKIDELYSQGYDIFMFISVNMLDVNVESSTIPDHWVLYKGDLSFDSSGNATFKVFTWGAKNFRQIKNISEQSFYNTYYGYIKAKW
jgi:hypothetical protein